MCAIPLSARPTDFSSKLGAKPAFCSKRSAVGHSESRKTFSFEDTSSEPDSFEEEYDEEQPNAAKEQFKLRNRNRRLYGMADILSIQTCCGLIRYALCLVRASIPQT